MTFVILGGGGVKIFQMSSFLKLCLKSILSYSESFETHLFLGENWVGTPKFLQVFTLFKGQKIFFFQNEPKYGLVVEKKIKNSSSS